MYRSILVPLDGSSFGEQALPLAAEIARRSGAVLQLAHVHEAVITCEGLSPLFEVGGHEVRARERSYLEKVAAQLRTGAASAQVTLLEGPAIADSLWEHARESQADLVVMTTHGRGPLSRMWLGSVADELVRRLPMPLLLLHPREATTDSSQGPALRRVLIALDGSPEAEAILGPATTLGRLWEAVYTLIRVVVPTPVVGLDLTGYAAGGLDLPQTDRGQHEAQTYLERVAQGLRQEGLQVATRVAVHRHPAIAVLEEGNAAELIALDTRGEGGIKRMLLGSVADKVLRGAVTPVLTRRRPEL